MTKLVINLRQLHIILPHIDIVNRRLMVTSLISNYLSDYTKPIVFLNLCPSL